MAYTENKSIDGLTAITPTTDDLVVTMDQTEVGVAKSSTLASIYNLFKTTYDTLYAKYLGDADFYKYSIVTSVASGNLTVALKNYEGNDPTPTKPVKIQIGGVIRTITASVFTYFLNAGTNYGNAGSTELATKEIDWFVYILDYNNSGAVFNIGISRYPLYNNLSEATGGYTSEKYLMQAGNIGIENVVNIGRFAATLSAGAGYTWSIPTYTASNLIQRPIYETVEKDYDAVVGYSGGTTNPTSNTIVFAKYHVIGSMCFFKLEYSLVKGAGDRTLFSYTLPFYGTSGQYAVANSACNINGFTSPWATIALGTGIVEVRETITANGGIRITGFYRI